MVIVDLWFYFIHCFINISSEFVRKKKKKEDRVLAANCAANREEEEVPSRLGRVD